MTTSSAGTSSTLSRTPLRDAGGDRAIRESLQRVLAIGRPNRLLDQRYEVRRPGGGNDGLEDRFWNLTNAPIFGRDGKVEFIIHSAEDVTELVRLKQKSLRPESAESGTGSSETERRYRFLANALPSSFGPRTPTD